MNSFYNPSSLYYQSANEIDGHTILGVCFSLKPAQGKEDRSAARSVLTYTLNSLKEVYPNVKLLDLRTSPLPYFNGQMPLDYRDSALEMTYSSINRCGALLFSIPSYWNDVSGVFKNFIDVLCGPIYDFNVSKATVFSNKPVGTIVVGADPVSAKFGSESAARILEATGAILKGSQVTISNPRNQEIDAAHLTVELLSLAVEVTKSVNQTHKHV